MPMRSADYQRGYDAGYKQALLDAVRQPSRDLGFVGRDPHEQLKHRIPPQFCGTGRRVPKKPHAE
jgi:hypothetical protein